MEPRAYSRSPTGVNIVLAACGRSTGEVLFDESLQTTDVSAEINSALLFYGRSFGFLGRSSSAAVVVPYFWGTLEGNVGEERKSIRRSGLGDVRMRFATNLLGDPALAPQEFSKRRSGTTLGASLAVIVPTGQYDAAKLINIGANRWAAKPELGLSQPAGRWFFEIYGGVWLLGDNRNFYGGRRREQKPIVSFQAHASYTLKPRFWLAANATFYAGGVTTVNGVESEDRQENSRYGLTVAVPVRGLSTLKLSAARGLTTRVGGNFTTLAVAYQIAWF
jgi:hypothetical protein